MPPTKLSHYVCSSTSEDHEHPAKELDQQAPHSRGWRSRPFCIYPQEIAFQLGTRAHIGRVQVLLHQLLIPERIDFFVGDVERGSDETYANARFAKLGYVSLSPPDEGGGKAREFKSVAVDCEGRFIKLVIHRNHMTKINKFNQVSIMGVNFLGDEKEPNNNNSVPEQRTGSAPLTHDGVNTYDDLAFNMYTDADSVKHIRKLEARKTDAVKNERYNYAQNCKLANELLQRAGLRLGKYDIEKRLAIEEENYDKAKQKKDHIEEYREAVHEALKVKQLLEEDGANSNNDLIMHLTLPPPPGKKKRPPTPPPKTPPRPQSDPLPPIPKTSEPPQPSVKKPLTPPPPIFAAPRAKTPPAAVAYNPAPEAASPVPPRGTFTPPGPGAAAWSPPASRRSKPQNKYALYEDRTLPAIRGKRLAAQAGIIMPEQDNSNKSPNLTDEDRKDASLPIEVFGEPLVGSFYARAFAEKEEGLRGLLASLKDDDDTVKADKKTRAATMLLQRTLKDKVYTVCHLGTETLDYLVGPFAAKRKTSRRELGSTIEAVTPELIHKTGDNATRVQTLAVDTLLRLADVAHARQIPAVATALTAPIQGNNVQARVAQTRLEVVEMIVVKHGVSDEPDSAMSVKHLTQFALSAIEHASDGVRAAGSRLLILIYPDNPKLVRKMLPPNDKKTRKSLTYRTLFEELDKMDGERRRMSPAHLSLDSPAPLQRVTSQSANGDRAEDTVPEVQETTPTRPAEDASLSRAVRSKSMSAMLMAEATVEDDIDDITCVFCGDVDKKYGKEDGMELHFWKHCPMLLRCSNCRQVVEIPSYTEHLLRECKDQHNYKCCHRCQEAIDKNKYDEHVRLNVCIPARSGVAGNHCPLCHYNTAPYDSGWKLHLMRECLANPRNGNVHKVALQQPETRTQPPSTPSAHQQPANTPEKPVATPPKPATTPMPRIEPSPRRSPRVGQPGKYSFATDPPLAPPAAPRAIQRSRSTERLPPAVFPPQPTTPVARSRSSEALKPNLQETGRGEPNGGGVSPTRSHSRLHAKLAERNAQRAGSRQEAPPVTPRSSNTPPKLNSTQPMVAANDVSNRNSEKRARNNLGSKSQESNSSSRGLQNQHEKQPANRIGQGSIPSRRNQRQDKGRNHKAEKTSTRRSSAEGRKGRGSGPRMEAPKPNRRSRSTSRIP